MRFLLSVDDPGVAKECFDIVMPALRPFLDNCPIVQFFELEGTIYAIGIIPPNSPDKYGMTHGLTRDVKRLLDEIPTSEHSYILKLSNEGPHKKLFKWEEDRWTYVY